MKFKLKIILLLMIVLLKGCATQGVKTLAAIDETKRVLVVSTMGDDYELMHIGFTVFSNKFNTIDVSDWQIDDVVEEKVSEFITDERFELVSHDISSLKNNMEKLENSFWSGNIVFKGFDEKIFPYALKENFDMVLFIHSVVTEDPVYFTGLNVGGFGLYKRSAFGRPSAKYYAISSVSLYDATTRKKIAGTMKTMSNFTTKYHNNRGVETIGYSDITEDKNVMFELILNGVKHQLKVLGVMK
ncbi:hypothetical protein OS175_13320 [Marinicella sp. S1101]|uniref:hypothetical protein n=1 Tax=Marinicella marina TaxID=2996016 RepID=UPI002260B35F|nr:hypothetical protein [Marinicella marina]MCX7554854.1 hypothetical protein [Marinicella marina]MDJ1141512.1 hypothetical protein [Marinicella marina]